MSTIALLCPYCRVVEILYSHTVLFQEVIISSVPELDPGDVSGMPYARHNPCDQTLLHPLWSLIVVSFPTIQIEFLLWLLQNCRYSFSALWSIGIDGSDLHVLKSSLYLPVSLRRRLSQTLVKLHREP